MCNFKFKAYTKFQNKGQLYQVHRPSKKNPNKFQTVFQVTLFWKIYVPIRIKRFCSQPIEIRVWNVSRRGVKMTLQALSAHRFFPLPPPLQTQR